MIVPIPGSSQTHIVLDAVDSEEVAQQFHAAGVDLHDAHHLGALARTSLLALRRHLARDPALYTPEWAAATVDQVLRRSLLLGGWNESRDGDRQIVERFTGQAYETVTENLSALDPGDAPIAQTGDLWHTVSPADSWVLMNFHLSRDDLTLFSDVAQEILTEADLFWGMTEDDLLRAQIEGVRSKYSTQLKQGVAASLALLGSVPRSVRGGASPASDAAPKVVHEILGAAEDDKTPKTWAAVAETLPLLAEAAPQAVLQALRACLSQPHPFAAAMFADENSGGIGFQPTSPHVRVLAALEILAWSPDNLMAVADVLAGLADSDPGGRLANRPAASLASIVCPWKPNTSASGEDRMTVVRMLRRSHGKVAWSLMLSMLPTRHDVQTPGHGPRFSDWKRAEPLVTPDEYTHMVASVAEMLLDDVGEDPDRWVSLVEHIASLPGQARSRMAEMLSRISAGEPDEDFRATVWPRLRDVVADHRASSDEHWVLSESELSPFDRVLDRLRPADAAIIYGELFSTRRMFRAGRGLVDDLAECWAALEAQQAEAVEVIIRNGGVEAVVRFAESVELPRQVGDAMARRDPNLDTSVLALMDDAPEVVTQVALGYFAHRFKAFGWDDLNKLIAANDPSPQVAADLHRAAPPVESPWSRVEALGIEAAKLYWARVSYYEIGIPTDLNELLEVTKQLRCAGRIELAKTVLARGSDAYESNLEFAEESATCLEQWIEHTPSECDLSPMTGFDLSRLITILDTHRKELGSARVVQIEWQYYPVLNLDPEFSASNLYRELGHDPDFFVWLVEQAFKPAGPPGDDSPQLTEAQRLMALNAYRVLHSWPESQSAPGLDDAGRVDAELLNEWVDNARQRLAEIHRTDIGDTMIGSALAACPPDCDGEWPGLAVRELIERLRSDSVDGGLISALRNKRSVTSRSLTDGGDQERELAENYRVISRRFQEWPRTSAILARLADSYNTEAAVHDNEAEVHRRGLPL